VSSNPVFVAFDVETTGLVAGVDRVVEVAAVSFQGDEVLDSFSRLVNPGARMPAVATRVTGITDEMIADAPPPSSVLPKFLAMLNQGTPVAHNAGFDVAFVCVEVEEAGLLPPRGQVLDTRGLARRAFPGRFSYSLVNLVQDLKLETPGAHRALSDAHACRQLFLACVRELEQGAPTKDPSACGPDGPLHQISIPELVRLSGALLDFTAHAPRQTQTARLLQAARVGGMLVDICYRASDGTLTGRRIKPLSFTIAGGGVAVVAWCSLRNDTRTFFLDSITDARLVP
jgi:DNA polymerase III epsilon subunit family exonuclease